jgi:hypothetical protein
VYIKLFRDILDSTIWMEPDYVVRVWLTFLLLSNQEGFVEIPIPALAQRARVTLDEAAQAIERLEKPDPYSRTSAENGARIVRVTDEKTLWHITNREKYAAMRSINQKRAYQREYMRDYRKRKAEMPTCEEKIHGLAQKREDRREESTSHTSAPHSMDDVFQTKFWDRWPTGRKVDRKKCERFFNRLPKKDQKAATGPALDAWLEDFAQRDRQYVPHPYTWLNNRRWEDDVPTRGKKKHSGHVDAESCDAAIAKIDHLVVALPTPLDGHLLDRLLWLKTEVQSAQEMLPAEGYEKIVAAEDFVLDWAADEYELDAKTTTERRLLARKKIGLPVLY